MINNTNEIISFDDTETAFSYKNNSELAKAHLLFTLMNNNALVRIATRLTPWAIRSGLPVKGLVRKTIFSQFCGGESLEQTNAVIDILSKHGVGVILDYGVEGKEEEAEFEKATQAFINSMIFAGKHSNIPFVSVKLTGLTSFSLLERVSNKETLTGLDQTQWEKAKDRLNRIADVASEHGVSLMIDAEESWIQNAIDWLCEEMMIRFNTKRAVVINTIQLYRHDRLQYLKEAYSRLAAYPIIQGYKLVRGAYMEKERRRAADLGYASPIQPNKEQCDRDYNLAIDFCMQHLDRVLVCIASHNEYSNKYAAEKAVKQHIERNHRHLHFSQLLGMSDHITFNLAKAGFNITKYLPYGPVGDVIPYLMRRAQENTSVAGQTGRELSLIRKERKRRKKTH